MSENDSRGEQASKPGTGHKRIVKAFTPKGHAETTSFELMTELARVAFMNAGGSEDEWTDRKGAIQKAIRDRLAVGAAVDSVTDAARRVPPVSAVDRIARGFRGKGA